MRVIQSVRDATPRAMAREQIQRHIAKQRLKRGDQLPTYAEFCQLLGFSPLTVQRAMGDLARDGIVYRMHGKGTYVGKVPRLGALALRRVGLVHNASIQHLIEAPYVNQMLSGILSGCAARDIDLNILSLLSKNRQASVQELSAQVDALVLIGIVNAGFVRGLLRTRLPIVLVDSRLPGLPIDTVLVDNAAAVQAVLRPLLALGHRRIAYVTGLTPDPVAGKDIASSDDVERREAFLAAMAEAGLADSASCIGPFRQADAALPAALAAVRAPDGPTALLCSSAMQAVQLQRVLSEAGVQVPEGVSLAGVAGVPEDVAGCPLDLDYARVDFRAMGSAAIAALERRCGAKPPEGPQLLRIGVERVRGRSIIAPPTPG